jgi:hypothetical protein
VTLRAREAVILLRQINDLCERYNSESGRMCSAYSDAATLDLLDSLALDELLTVPADEVMRRFIDAGTFVAIDSTGYAWEGHNEEVTDAVIAAGFYNDEEEQA